MKMTETAIKVENISKVYRIGFKEVIQDSIGATLFQFIKSPLQNYRRYRSLYKFDDIYHNTDSKSKDDYSDVLWALRDVSFEVRKGDVLGIIGSNGAGKSTLLKILSKITCPTNGYAEIYGRVSSLLEVGTGFHRELTGRENIYLNGTILGMSKKEVDQKFDEIVEFSGVEKFIDTPVKRYSSGMTVRLAFAVAAHLEPEILIIDEVLAVGDAAFQKKCLQKMEDVGREGRTVIFVSHNMQAVTRLCDRVILLDSGKVIEDGPSFEVVRSYLKSIQYTPASREWPDLAKAPGNDIVRLQAVRVRDEEGRAVAAVDICKPVGIEMKYHVLKPGFSLLPHFCLFNESGVFVFVGLDLDPAWTGRSRPTGTYISTGWIPGNLLAEGTMFIAPVMRTVEPDIVHFAEDNTVSFEVVDSSGLTAGGYVNEIPGVVRPLLEWTTQFEPSDSEGASTAVKSAKG